MTLDIYIITVYCLVVDFYKEIMKRYSYSLRRLRQRGFEPKLTDEEVITIELVGEFLGLEKDKDIFDYFYRHWRHFFPQLTDRTLFVRQGANLWKIKELIWQRITQVSGDAYDTTQIIDTIPLPVCVITRAKRDRCFYGEADYGYCAAKKMHYYGFKGGLRMSYRGMITHCPLLEARPHDLEHLDVLLEGFRGGLILGDKGFISKEKKAELKQIEINLQTPFRKNMKERERERETERETETGSYFPSPLLMNIMNMKWLNRMRRLIETVGSQLVGRYHIEAIRVRNCWHFQSRLIRKILSHTVAVFLNIKLGREPLDFDSLVTNAPCN
jgi:hypothetical protein